VTATKKTGRLSSYEERVFFRAGARSYLLRAADLFEQIGLTDYAERHRRAVK